MIDTIKEPLSDENFVTALIAFITSLLFALIKGWLDKGIESHKSNLKRKEFFNDKEIDAAKEFISIIETSKPKISIHINEYNYYYSEYASNYYKLTQYLDDFILRNKLFVPYKIGLKISQISMEIALENTELPELSIEIDYYKVDVLKQAKEFHDKLDEIKEEFIISLRNENRIKIFIGNVVPNLSFYCERLLNFFNKTWKRLIYYSIKPFNKKKNHTKIL